MIILVAGEKGGTGKTTLATNLATMLASRDREVLLLDTDTQGSATDWGSIRDAREYANRVTVVQRTGAVNALITQLAPKYDDMVIDAGGRDTDAMRSAMIVAHIWYVPVQPSQFDVWTVTKMGDMYTAAKTYNPNLRAYLLVNRASTHSKVNDYDTVLDVLKESEAGMSMSRACIRERSAYRKAAALGCGVNELPKMYFDKKAAQEIDELFDEIVNWE